jgi:hypothetical protein
LVEQKEMQLVELTKNESDQNQKEMSWLSRTKQMMQLVEQMQ